MQTEMVDLIDAYIEATPVEDMTFAGLPDELKRLLRKGNHELWTYAAANLVLGVARKNGLRFGRGQARGISKGIARRIEEAAMAIMVMFGIMTAAHNAGIAMHLPTEDDELSALLLPVVRALNE